MPRATSGAALLSQALNDVDVLTWKVLMNEKKSHRHYDLKSNRSMPRRHAKRLVLMISIIINLLGDQNHSYNRKFSSQILEIDNA